MSYERLAEELLCVVVMDWRVGRKSIPGTSGKEVRGFFSLNSTFLKNK